MKKLIILCVVFAVLLFGVNMLAPTAAEQGFYHSLTSKTDIRPGDLQVTASPGLKVLFGDLDTVAVHRENLHIEDVQFDRFDCQLEGVHYSLADSIINGRMAVASAQSGELTAVISNESLQDFLVRKVDKLSDPQVSFDNDRIQVSGVVNVGGVLKARAELRGTFSMKGSKLMFVPESINIDGLGKSFSTMKPTNIEVYDFGKFPLGIQPDSVTMDNQVLTIHGSVHHT